MNDIDLSSDKNLIQYFEDKNSYKFRTKKNSILNFNLFYTYTHLFINKYFKI